MNPFPQHHEQPPGYSEATETVLPPVGAQNQTSQKSGRKSARRLSSQLSQPKKAVKGNNKYGNKGTCKCLDCRRLKRACEFSSPEEPCQECQTHGRPCGPKVYSGQQPQGLPQPPIVTTTEETPSVATWSKDIPWLPKIAELAGIALDKAIQKLKDEISEFESQSHPAPQAVKLEELNGWSESSPQVPPWSQFNDVPIFQDAYTVAPLVDYSNQMLSNDFYPPTGFVNSPNTLNAQQVYRNSIPILGAGPSLPTTVTINPQELSLPPELNSNSGVPQPPQFVGGYQYQNIYANDVQMGNF